MDALSDDIAKEEVSKGSFVFFCVLKVDLGLSPFSSLLFLTKA